MYGLYFVSHSLFDVMVCRWLEASFPAVSLPGSRSPPCAVRMVMVLVVRVHDDDGAIIAALRVHLDGIIIPPCYYQVVSGVILRGHADVHIHMCLWNPAPACAACRITLVRIPGGEDTITSPTLVETLSYHDIS